jgi:hypothetical protein
MKKLYRYYYYVGIPVFLVFLGTVLFYGAIAATVKGNPHPQINYVIFGLIAVGCYQMVSHVYRINQEFIHFYKFRKAVKDGASHAEIQILINRADKHFDIALLLQLIEELRGKALNSVQHSAVEAELERFGASQSRRLMLSNFMSGMMVGMGLLGTFIGLLGALEEIGKLIGSFSLGAGMTDPVGAITELVARLTAPMQAMGVAFSASLFGVLGSLIMGLLMVSVKSATSDLVALVQSGTSFMMDITDDHKNLSMVDLEPVTEALSNLAEHSPLLRGLTVALDQSERRVRELMQGMGSLMGGMQIANHSSALLLNQLTEQASQKEDVLHMIQTMQASMKRMAESQTEMSQGQARASEVLERQNANLVEIFQTHATASNTIQRHGFENMAAQWIHTQRLMAEHAAQTELLLTEFTESHKQTSQAQFELNRLVSQSTQTLQNDSASRTQFVTRLDSLLTENKDRNEQLIHMVATRTETASL